VATLISTAVDRLMIHYPTPDLPAGVAFCGFDRRLARKGMTFGAGMR